MTKKAISWVLVGAFAYLWWWAGHRWPYINVKGNEWQSVYVLFTLISLAVLTRSARAAGAGMLGGLVGTVRNFLPNLLGLALAIIVARSLNWLLLGVVNPVDHFTHAVVAVVVAGFTTSLWYGAIVNATEDS
jgi:hypothetical protein